MVRTAFLRTFSLMLLGLGFEDTAIGQTTLSPLLARASTDLPSRASSAWNASERSQGTLLLCGGGVIPSPIRDEFHRLGKGEDGTLVLIPTASPRSDSGDYSTWIDYWSSFRWKNVEVVHAANRDAAFDASLVAIMRRGTAVWVSGGEQQRLSDRYVGTPIEEELHALYGRGGIIGGTSAGAAIASGTMIADGISEPQFANGLRFLPGTIIDQHFSQRKRQSRLIKAIEAYPNRIGIGIDESTALLVNREEARVVGDGNVFLFKSQNGDAYRRLQAGEMLKTQTLNSPQH